MLSRESQGLVVVFTGDGKGKTSAAMGVVLRAAGHGFRIHVIFFMKGEFPYGEQKSLALLPKTSLERFGLQAFCDPSNVKKEEREEARQALQAAQKAVLSSNYDLVILDEINLAAAWGLIPVEEVVELIKEKPPPLDLVLTGRYADARILELADVVTEMVEAKHSFRQGIKARRGIDF